MRYAYCGLLAAFLWLGIPPPAPAADTAAPTDAMLAPVQHWIDAFNANQTLPEDVFTDDVVLTDQFPPFVWNGKAAMQAWSKRIEQGFHNSRVKSEHVAVEAPRAFMLDRAGNRASFVFPATLTYELDGKPTTDKALWLFVVVKNPGGSWQIAADTWTRTDA